MKILKIHWCITLFLTTSDAFWGGGQGGGFNSGYNGHHGFGYGPGNCAGARRQNQQQVQLAQKPQNFGFGGYNNYQDPISQPYNNNIDYRANFPTARTTLAPVLTCPYPNSRDATVFDQKCIFPSESEKNDCASRASTVFSTGTISIVSCKAPQYYSETGDVILEICSNGRWHSDGKILTCKSRPVMPQPFPPPAMPNRNPDPVAQYVQNPYVDEQPAPVIHQPSNPYNYHIAPAQQPSPSQNYNPYTDDGGQPPYKGNENPVGPLPIHSEEPKTAAPDNNYFSPSQNSTYHWNTPAPVTVTSAPTTFRTTEASTAEPYHFPDNIDWRNYAGNPHLNSTASSENKSGNCPALVKKPGMILECLSKTKKTGSSGYLLSVSECEESQAPGTEATQRCQMYYEPLSGLSTQYRKCKENGDWSGNEDGYGCRLECGKSNPGGRLPLITFGEMTVLGAWPWHAGLFIRDRETFFENACGGTLIGKRAVLTAAHCVNLHLSSLLRDLNDIQVHLGRYHRTKEDPYVQKFEVAKIISHPAYNPFMFESDIAVIILKEPAKIGFHVRPICFPKTQNTAFDEMQLSDGSYATVVGWGLDETGESPNELRAAKLKVLGYKECIESFEEADTGALLAKSTTFCASNKNGTNVCRGDSGGGAYFPVKTATGSTQWFLLGLVSVGINVSGNNKKCDPERVSIFSRVSPYSDWIGRILQENDAF